MTEHEAFNRKGAIERVHSVPFALEKAQRQTFSKQAGFEERPFPPVIHHLDVCVCFSDEYGVLRFVCFPKTCLVHASNWSDDPSVFVNRRSRV